jgi:outer membrane protein assembly factor BamE (lipoprotein component of BamABCDE complex)
MTPRLMLTAIALGLAGLAFAYKPAHAADVTKGLIRGGIGVASVELGMTEAQVRAQLGEPETVNKGPNDQPLYMSYHATDNFGVYFDEATGRVRMLIVAVKSGEICTAYGACLYREGDLAKVKKHYGKKLIRFVDRDGSVTYRRLVPMKPRNVLVEFTPAEDKNGIVQVMMMHWDGKITDSSFD